MKNSEKTRYLVLVAVFAAVYVVLCAILQPISFGPIQFRFSEMLCLAAIDYKWALWGVSIGCLLSNLFIGGLGMADVIFGTAATIIGCSLAYYFRARLFKGYPVLSALMIVVVNALIVGAELAFVLDEVKLMPLFMLEVGFGELVVLAIGLPIYKHLKKLFEAKNVEVK